jgi:hypothetical protein
VEVVRYQVDADTEVAFEIEPSPGFRPPVTAGLAGSIRDAVAPVVQAARAVLEKIKEAGPDEAQVRFGIKVSGAADWLVAKAASEGAFEVTLSWRAAPLPGSEQEPRIGPMI